MSFFAMTTGTGDVGIKIVGSVAGNVSTTDAQVHSLGNINVGSSDSDKNAILTVSWFDAGGRTIITFTIGGVSLTEKVTASAIGSNVLRSAIWAGDISSISGSQAISVTFSSDVQSSGVSGVAVSNLESLTPTMSDTDSTISGAQLTITNLAAQTGGIVVGGGASADFDATASWGSVTERSDVQTGGASGDHRHSAAWDLGRHAAANETLDFTGGDERLVVGAGFR